MKIGINHKIEKVASRDECRAVLNHLHVVKNHPVLGCDALEATDGRQYVAIPVTLEKGDVGEYVDPALLADARKGHRVASKATESPVPFDTMSIRLRKRWTQTMDKILRKRKPEGLIGTYPKTVSIMPRVSGVIDDIAKPKDTRTEPGVVAKYSLNAEYLVSIQRAMNAGGVTLTFYGEKEPVEVEPISGATNKYGGASGYGILMPMRRAD